MKNIHLIAVKEDILETTVIVTGDGAIPDYMTQMIETPPRIIIDIFCETVPFESISGPVSGSMLYNIRVGYHPKSIRMVLDLNGPGIPRFSVVKRQNEMQVVLSPAENHGSMGKPSAQKPQLSPEKKPDSHPIRTAEMGSIGEQNSGLRIPAAPGPEVAEVPMAKHVRIVRPYKDQGRSVGTLLRIEKNDGLDDTRRFTDAVSAYEARKWGETIDHLSQLIKSYPDGRYAEKSYFLLAKTYEQLNSTRLSSRFNEVKGAYEDAVYRYPESVYIPDAYVSIGNICFNVKDYLEARAYYNLVIEKGKDAAAILMALMQKAKILSLKGKHEETLPIYEQVVFQYPGTIEEIQAKLEMVKILYDMNNFRKSLHILAGLENQLVGSYAYPEIFLYLGNNYYQLGDNMKARKDLFKFYNLCPDEENSHLVLTRIADIYREEKQWKDAAKFYKLVMERYPDTEGALISMYRLAEQQEKGEITVSLAKLAPKIEIVDKEVSVPRKIYEDVIQKGLEKDESSPLIQFALLKLSILDKNEENYEKGLTILKELLRKYPRTKLRKEIEHTLEEILLSILKKDFKAKQYQDIVNVYHNEKDLIQGLRSPEIFLIAARASLGLKLSETAVELFYKADPLLSNQQKPPDLLLHIGRNLMEIGELKQAGAYLDLLLSKQSSGKDTFDLYRLKGDIFLAEQKYPQALETFAHALKMDPPKSVQTRIHLAIAKALMALNEREKAYRSVQEAENVSRQSNTLEIKIYQEIGESYVGLGYPNEALAIIKYAMSIPGNEKGTPSVMLLMARCYEALNKKKEYLAIYNEIVAGNDAFWSSVAREKIEEADFKDIISQKKK